MGENAEIYGEGGGKLRDFTSGTLRGFASAGFFCSGEQKTAPAIATTVWRSIGSIGQLIPD
jgi:hypothetical protein